MRPALPAPLPREAALIVIDVQRAIDHPSWGERNNPGAEKNIAALLAGWRASKRPVYHTRHDSIEPTSHYRPGQPGNDFKPEAQPVSGADVQAMSLSNLDGEYCAVVRTDAVLEALGVR
jgi:nicotinamidase-related amidase